MEENANISDNKTPVTSVPPVAAPKITLPTAGGSTSSFGTPKASPSSFSLPKASSAPFGGAAAPATRPASFMSMSDTKSSSDKVNPIMLVVDFCAAVCAIAFTVLFFLDK